VKEHPVVDQLVKEIKAIHQEGCLHMGSAPVGGRLSAFAEKWQNPFYQHVLKSGLEIRWDSAPPPDFDNGEFKPESHQEMILVEEELRSLLDKKAIELADSNHGHIYRWFLVSKKGTTAKRPVLNMKPGNAYVKYIHFKLEDLKTVKDVAQKGDWAVRIDLKDAYLQVPIAASNRKFLRFRHCGTVYQWRVLPFGYRDAPRLFQKLMVEALKEPRLHGCRLVIYLDDILLLSHSRQQCLQHLKEVLAHLLLLGFMINTVKSVIVPTQRILFLGIILDLTKMTFELPQEKLITFKKRVKKLLKKKNRKFSLLELQSIVGTLISINECIMATRIHINSLIELIRKALVTPDGLVTPSPQAIVDLVWWKENITAWNGKSMLPVLMDEILEVDASSSGLGAVRKTPGKMIEVAHRILDLEDKRHNNIKEMLAAEFGLHHFSEKLNWTHKSILIKTDNTTTMSYINRMGGRIPEFCRVSERIHQFALSRNLTVKAEWIPGKDNKEADRASRVQEDYKESKLNPQVFQIINQFMGPLEIDLFASVENAQLEKFVSLRSHPMNYYFDCLASSSSERGYAYPPFILIPRVLQKVRLEKIESLTLIAPLWTTQAWWPNLQELIAAPPLFLPRIPDLLLVGQNFLLPKWETVAFRLSGRLSTPVGYLNPLLSCFYIDTRSGRIKKKAAYISMKESGETTCTGVDH